MYQGSTLTCIKQWSPHPRPYLKGVQVSRIQDRYLIYNAIIDLYPSAKDSSMTLRTVLLLITLTTSSMSFACQCAPEVKREDCVCNTTISPYLELLEEIDQLLEETADGGQEITWVERLPFGWGDVLIEWIPAIEPEYRRLYRARHQLEGEIYKRLSVTPPWQLAAQVDDGRVVVYGHEPLSCDTVQYIHGVDLTWVVCGDMDITYAIGELSAFLKNPMLMNPNQPHKVRYFLLNLDTMEEKPLSR